MIKKHSDDPDVVQAAQLALDRISETLVKLPKAEMFDYGGHELHIGEYDVCPVCTNPIAEAQQAANAITEVAGDVEEDIVKEHLLLAAHLFEIEAEAAIIRAEFHNGQGTEKILNGLLGFMYERGIQDDYKHSHHQGN